MRPREVEDEGDRPAEQDMEEEEEEDMEEEEEEEVERRQAAVSGPHPLPQLAPMEAARGVAPAQAGAARRRPSGGGRAAVRRVPRDHDPEAVLSVGEVAVAVAALAKVLEECEEEEEEEEGEEEEGQCATGGAAHRRGVGRPRRPPTSPTRSPDPMRPWQGSLRASSTATTVATAAAGAGRRARRLRPRPAAEERGRGGGRARQRAGKGRRRGMGRRELRTGAAIVAR